MSEFPSFDGIDKAFYKSDPEEGGPAIAAPVEGLTLAPEVRGKCPRHGEQTTSLDLYGLRADLNGKYCLMCYAEWIAATFPRLT